MMLLITKSRSIEQLHTLWLKTVERREKLRIAVCDYIDKIIAEIEPNKEGEHIVYFNTCGSDKNEQTNKYVFSYNNTFKGFGYHVDHVDVNKDRQAKINDIVRGKAYDLGNEFYSLEKKSRTYLEGKVFEVLWREIQEYLQKNFENSKLRNKIITITIGDKQYYIDAINQGGWHKFEWRGEKEEINIDLTNKPSTLYSERHINWWKEMKEIAKYN